MSTVEQLKQGMDAIVTLFSKVSNETKPQELPLLDKIDITGKNMQDLRVVAHTLNIPPAKKKLELIKQIEDAQPIGILTELNQRSRKLLDALSQLDGSSLGITFQFPSIIVIGNESSGKSSLVERISMLPFFPRGNESQQQSLCTRMPIRLCLQYMTTQELIDFSAEHKLKLGDSDNNAFVLLCNKIFCGSPLCLNWDELAGCVTIRAPEMPYCGTDTISWRNWQQWCQNVCTSSSNILIGVLSVKILSKIIPHFQDSTLPLLICRFVKFQEQAKLKLHKMIESIIPECQSRFRREMSILCTIGNADLAFRASIHEKACTLLTTILVEETTTRISSPQFVSDFMKSVKEVPMSELLLDSYNEKRNKLIVNLKSCETARDAIKELIHM